MYEHETLIANVRITIVFEMHAVITFLRMNMDYFIQEYFKNGMGANEKITSFTFHLQEFFMFVKKLQIIIQSHFFL